MFIVQILFVLLIAALLTAVFAAGFRRREWDVGLLYFFLILFLATWAGGLWVGAYGPLLWGVPWMTFLLVGVLLALLLTALIPPRRRRPFAEREAEPQRPPRPDETDVDTLVSVDVLFWILTVGLVIVIIAAYV